MKNLSSLSKAVLLANIIVVANIISIIWHFVSHANLDDYILDGVFAILAFLIARYINRAEESINHYTETLTKIAEGDFEARIIHVYEFGNLAKLAHAINRAIDLTDAFVREVCNSMEAVSEGKYFRKVLERGLPGIYRRSAIAINSVTTSTENKVGKFLVYTDNFDSNVKVVINNLTEEAKKLQNSAENMSQNAESTSNNLNISVNSANQAGENVRNVAAAAEELTASISEVSGQVSRVSLQIDNAAQEATQAENLVVSLNQAAVKVGNIIQLINTIASQTNLLALNATIESARAGDAGRGFAVVANEVKNLAAETAKATDEIRQEIETMQNATDKAVDAVNHIGEAIRGITKNTSSITTAVKQQEFATQEIARSINQVALNMNEVTGTISDINNSAVETKKSSAILLDTAEGFTKQAVVLNSEVDKFLKACAIK